MYGPPYFIYNNRMQINPNIIVIESLPGAGGDESKIWGRELLLSYIRFAEKNGMKAHFLEENMIRLTGPNAFKFFKHEL